MRYWRTLPSAGSQRTFRELVVGSVTFRFFTPPSGSDKETPHETVNFLLVTCWLNRHRFFHPSVAH